MVGVNDLGSIDAAAGDLLLVSVPSGANAVDEDCQVVLIGEDYPLVAKESL